MEWDMGVPQRSGDELGGVSNTPYAFSLMQHRVQFTAHCSNRWHSSSRLILSISWKEEFFIFTVTSSDKGYSLLPLVVCSSHQRVLEKQNTERFLSLCMICLHFYNISPKKPTKHLTPKLNHGNKEKVFDLSNELQVPGKDPGTQGVKSPRPKHVLLRFLTLGFSPKDLNIFWKPEITIKVGICLF